MALRNRGLNQMEDVCLWKRETGYYKEGFLTSQTWELIRIKSPRVMWHKGIWFQEVWYGTIGDLAGNRSLHRWSQIIQFLANGLHERNLTFLLRYSFQVVLYAVWHERNVRRVGETSQPAACLIARLDKLVRNRITSLRRKNGRKYEKTMEVWFGRR
ncbi:hypothetical protein BRARA_C00922 [Brassica rapa]|uniref:Reverse transcriptase zinc-binding domain-containing protein n=1 Tax=Brassica campestris TaxID=3711 RepID=A0A397ZWG0_BRACM|nr:hypothetical protein BRARA_C00922 [Brassica rapa]